MMGMGVNQDLPFPSAHKPVIAHANAHLLLQPLMQAKKMSSPKFPGSNSPSGQLRVLPKGPQVSYVEYKEVKVPQPQKPGLKISKAVGGGMGPISQIREGTDRSGKPDTLLAG